MSRPEPRVSLKGDGARLVREKEREEPDVEAQLAALDDREAGEMC